MRMEIRLSLSKVLLRKSEVPVESKPSTKKKAMKPLKKPKKVDKEEKKFEDMVQSYKNTFAGISEKTEIKEPENPRKNISGGMRDRRYDLVGEGGEGSSEFEECAAGTYAATIPRRRWPCLS